MSVTLLRCLIMYLAVTVAVRLMGKRQIGELQPSELVITILISELAAMPIQDKHLPLISGILPIFALAGFELIISLATLKSIKFRTFLYGHPLILMYNGKFRQRQMSEARVTVDDIMEVMRNNGISDITQVDFAVLETNGQLSVIEKKNPTSAGLAHLVILDGRMIRSNLHQLGLTPKWIMRQLHERRLSSPNEVFLMTVDDSYTVYVVPKE